jgi:uncharacterized RDD family membrane protein YckC
MVDLVILAIPLAVFVSFLSVGTGTWNAFLDLHPGQPPGEILARFGRTNLLVILCFFVVKSWLYFAILESSPWRASVGKRLLGLHLADANGNPIGFWLATRRFVGGRLLLHLPYIGAYYFLGDCLCVALIPSKRAIHDILAGCLVLRENVE